MYAFFSHFIFLILLIGTIPLSHAEKFYEKPHESVTSRFQEGYASFRKYDDNGKFIGMGMIDHDHNIIIPPIYDDLALPDKGRVIARIKNAQGERMIGILDLQNNWLIQPQRLDVMFDFKDDMAMVKLNGKYGHVNRQGKIVVPIIYDNATAFESGKAAVQIGGLWGQWGFVDKTGQLIIKPQFDYVKGFYGDTGVVCRYRNGTIRVDKCTLIDEKGHFKMPYVYADMSGFVCGVARTLSVEGQESFIDKNGQVLVPEQIGDKIEVRAKNDVQTDAQSCQYTKLYPNKYRKKAIYIDSPIQSK